MLPCVKLLTLAAMVDNGHCVSAKIGWSCGVLLHAIGRAKCVCYTEYLGVLKLGVTQVLK